MNPVETRLAKQLLAGEIEPGALPTEGTSPAGQIRVLDLAAETVEFRYFRHELEKEEYRRRYIFLLQARVAPTGDTDRTASASRPAGGKTTSSWRRESALPTIT